MNVGSAKVMKQCLVSRTSEKAIHNFHLIQNVTARSHLFKSGNLCILTLFRIHYDTVKNLQIYVVYYGSNFQLHATATTFLFLW